MLANKTSLGKRPLQCFARPDVAPFRPKPIPRGSIVLSYPTLSLSAVRTKHPHAL